MGEREVSRDPDSNPRACVVCRDLLPDGGRSETERLERAIREAVTLVNAGDSVHAVARTVREEYDLEHRRDDLLEHLHDRLGEDDRDGEIAADGGLGEVFRRETIVGTSDGIAVGEDAVPTPATMRCHDCDESHVDWHKDGEGAVDDGSHVGILERWRCGRCGAILEGGRL